MKINCLLCLIINIIPLIVFSYEGTNDWKMEFRYAFHFFYADYPILLCIFANENK